MTPPYPRVDYHIHSTFSECASQTMQVENIVRQAKKKGLDCIAITDHVDLPEHTWRCEALAQEVARLKPDIRVLVGCEAEATGECLPVDEQFASGLDIVLASTNHIHSLPTSKLPEDTTEAYAQALADTIRRAASLPWAHVISHPLLMFEARSDLDEALALVKGDTLVEALSLAAANGLALEMSPRAFRSGSPGCVADFFRLCKDSGTKVSFGSDAHSPAAVGHLAHVYPLAARAGLQPSDILVL